tara:strand:+ start:82 stop:510 length:429 start_codon:yes stop_codon:yes gene_type:complete
MSVLNQIHSGTMEGVSSELHGCDTISATAKITVKVLANGALAVGSPVGLYYTEAGVLTGIKVAADSNTVAGHWGISEAAIADGEYGLVTVRGLAVCASGGTAGQLVTAISNAGVITSAAAANTNADTGVLGTCSAAGSILIY